MNSFLTNKMTLQEYIESLPKKECPHCHKLRADYGGGILLVIEKSERDHHWDGDSKEQKPCTSRRIAKKPQFRFIPISECVEHEGDTSSYPLAVACCKPYETP